MASLETDSVYPTYLAFSEASISVETLQSTVTKFLSKYDVFSGGSLSTVIIGGPDLLTP